MSILSRLRRRRGDGSERDALARAAGGDERALERLYTAHVDGLYGFVFYRVGRDPALAEDVVQETFAQAIDALDRFDPERGSLHTWLCTLSRNVIRDHLREHRRGAELASAWEAIDASLAQIFENLDRAPLADEVLARAETRDLVNMTIANLPEKYRAVLARKYVDGESLDELARGLALTPDAAKSLLARARTAFRDTFHTLCESLAEAKP
jgi:RNA polymerase sigma-70 factor (ECF subfamily)